MKGQNDIVYILKADAPTEELRYSLRSVVRNFAFRDVWFYCGCPDGLVPDHHVPFVQRGISRFERSSSTLRAICENDEITPTFYLFNDDFFVMHRYDQDKAIVQGSIDDHVRRLPRHGEYWRRLVAQRDWLRDHGYPTADYATHTPLPVDRERALEVIDMAGADRMLLFRNLYGNVAGVPYVQHDDVKLHDTGDAPDPDAPVLSSNDKSFANGLVGEHVRGVFERRCRFEAPRGA